MRLSKLSLCLCLYVVALFTSLVPGPYKKGVLWLTTTFCKLNFNCGTRTNKDFFVADVSCSLICKTIYVEVKRIYI